MEEAPAPTPEPGSALDCPEIADCTGYECGVEPVCGKECGTCDDGSVCIDRLEEEDPLARTECCVPESCGDLAAVCGVHDDGCGGTITCGTCLNGSACANEDGGWTCDCVQINDGGAWQMDVVTTILTVHLLIDGEAPPLTASTETDFGAVVLKPAGGDHAVLWDSMYRGTWDHDEGAARETVDVRLMPGPYDVYYKRVGNDPTSVWPLNELTLLASDVDVPEGDGTAIEIDLTPIRLPVDLRLAGVPLRDVPTVEGQGVMLELRTAADDGGQWCGLENPYPDSAPVYVRGDIVGWHDDMDPVEVTLLPGSYGLYFSNNLPTVNGNTPFGGTQWPLGWNVSVANLPLGETATELTVDLPFTEVTIDVSLEGAPVGFADLFGPDEPALQVRRVVGNSDEGPGHGGLVERPPWLDLPPLYEAASETVGLPLTVRLFDDLYEVAYRNDRESYDTGEPPSEWPANTGLVAEFTAADGILLPLDIESVEIEFQTTLAGEELSSGNTSASNHGRLMLKSATTFSPAWSLPTFIDGFGAVDPVHVLQVLPDRYGLGYTSEDRSAMPDWPTNLTGGVFLEDVDLTADGALAVDIPVVEVDLVASYPGEATGTPAFRLANPQAETVTSWEGYGWVPDPTAEAALIDYEPLRVVPGSYRGVYVPSADELAWPHATMLLWEELELTGDVVLPMDLNFRQFAVHWTLDGETETGPLSTAQDHGSILVTKPEPPRSSLNDIASIGGSHAVNLPLGSYFIHYYPAQELFPDPDGAAPYATVWPLTTASSAGCLLVQ
ncbi:MAG: hypothetical protein GY898_28350 [Proteobacteria bacterium]|nr:hypothetical protein [Pseudomonadota bacterium]